DVSLSGTGTLTAPAAGTFTVSGNWSKTGGGSTFTANGGTVTFDGAAQTLDSGGSAFGSVVHSGTGTLQLINNALSVGGTFTNSASTFDANDLAVTVTGLATVSGGTYLAKTGLQTFNGGLTV